MSNSGYKGKISKAFYGGVEIPREKIFIGGLPLLGSTSKLNKFFTVQDYDIKTSSDGISWTTLIQNSSYGTFLRIAYWNGFYIIATTNGVYTLPVNAPPNTPLTKVLNQTLSDVAMDLKADNGVILLTLRQKVIRSTDAINWKVVFDDEVQGWYRFNYPRLEFGNGVWVLSLQMDPSTSSYRAYSVDNGLTWNVQGTSDNLMLSAVFGNGVFLKTGAGAWVPGELSTINYSVNGISWSRANKATILRQIGYFAFSEKDNKWVCLIVNQGGWLYLDANYNPSSVIPSNILFCSIAYGNDKLLASDYYGSIYEHTNNTWNFLASNIGNKIYFL